MFNIIFMMFMIFLAGTIFRLKGAIVGMSFLDCNGILIQGVYEQWRDSVSSERGSTSNLQNYEKRERERDNREREDNKSLKTPSK